MDARFEVAVTHLDLAELAGRQGDLGAAAEHLGHCRGTFAALGAPAYLERADHLARRLEEPEGGDAGSGRSPDRGPPGQGR
jgi:hypothetical protein